MSLTKRQKKRLDQLIDPLLADLDIELVDIKLRQVNQTKELEVVIDKEGGVTVEDCARASREISLILDAEDLFSFQYALEVGSPGIFRELKKESEFLKFMNSRVKAVYYTAGKNKKKFIGLLTHYQDHQITLKDEKQQIMISKDQIKKIQLYPEIKHIIAKTSCFNPFAEISQNITNQNIN